MAEPTVQVPVSLIEHIVRVLDRLNLAPGIAYNLRALLSQSAPTAVACERCGGTGYQGDGPFTAGAPCPDCAPAAPPRIEDMAPGTTFTARVRWPGAVDDHFTVMSGPANIWLRGEQYEVTVPDRIDPSTIRDVTPPSVTS